MLVTADWTLNELENRSIEIIQIKYKEKIDGKYRKAHEDIWYAHKDLTYRYLESQKKVSERVE